MKKAVSYLPQGPRKEVEIIQSLASKYQIRVKIHENRGHPRKELSEGKKDWVMIESLSRNGITHANPGCQDNIDIAKVDGERNDLPRQYLLWILKDFLDIINGCELHSSNFVSRCLEKLTFPNSRLYQVS